MSQLNGETSVKQQGNSQWGICASCRAEGCNKKKCSRCRQVSYCNKDCQMNDFQRHKDHCKLFARFTAAESKIGPQIRKNSTTLSFHLGSIPDHTRYKLLGPRFCVLVEIIDQPRISVLGLVILVRDVDNQTTQVGMHLLTVLSEYNWSLDLLMVGLVPTAFGCGKFILLSNVYWNNLETERETIDIVSRDQLSAIDMSRQS